MNVVATNTRTVKIPSWIEMLLGEREKFRMKNDNLHVQKDQWHVVVVAWNVETVSEI